MGSVSDFTLPPLIPLERIGVLGYIRYVFPFKLQDDYDINEVASILKAGYDATKQWLPVLDCEAVPDTDSKQAGVSKLQRLKDGEGGDIEHIAVKDLRKKGAFPMTYAELEAKNFPPSAFDGETLCRCAIFPEPDQRTPVSLAQANFIPGGMVLTWCLVHIFGDSVTFFNWIKIWARECRRAQGIDISSEPVESIDAMTRDRERLMKPSGRNPGLLEDHPEYTLLPFTPSGTAPHMLSQNRRAEVFYFSPAALAALKAEASPANASEPSDDQKWISTNDALSALIWHTELTARWSLDSIDGDPVSDFCVFMNGRLRTDPPVHPDTLGGFLELISVSAPVRKIAASNLNLADLALLIRKKLRCLTGQFTDDIAALVEKLPDVTRLVMTPFLDDSGFSLGQTSWAAEDFYGLEWGPILGDRFRSVRMPKAGVLNGLHVVLPVLPNGGMEIIITTEPRYLDKVRNNPLLRKFTKMR